jgi:hypothetical protein
MDKQTYDTWWINKNNFTEKDLNLYKEILMKTHSLYQNNDPASRMPKYSIGKNGKISYQKYGKK